MITFNAAKAVVAPYWVYIKVAVFLLCVAVSATLGYRYGTSTSRVEVAKLAAETASLRQANATYAKTADEASRIVAEAAARAADVQKQGQVVGAQVAKTNDRLQKAKIADLQKANEALKDAKCQELMRMSVCENVPLP